MGTKLVEEVLEEGDQGNRARPCGEGQPQEVRPAIFLQGEEAAMDKPEGELGVSAEMEGAAGP